ncbi:ATP-binding protein [Streptomyces sp. DH7]|uniref:ATP-binding protein n=1 Tax=Streptomyces sp. DH7 TaxID=2857006 RepID=UPI001E5FBB28
MVARLASGRNAVAESTNVTPQARGRLIAIADRFNVPVIMLRFDPEVTDLLQQYTERGRTDLAAADVRSYAATMNRDASADQLRSEGATTVHDVPGSRQATTPAEAAAHFSFACDVSQTCLSAPSTMAGAVACDPGPAARFFRLVRCSGAGRMPRTSHERQPGLLTRRECR